MGIRFFCPSGHRLNVKSFLAGKRGVCPECGIGVDIPMESDTRAVASKRRSAGGNDDEAHGNPDAVAVLDGDPPEIEITTSAAHNDFALPPSLLTPAPSPVAAPKMPEFSPVLVRPAPQPVLPTPIASSPVVPAAVVVAPMAKPVVAAVVPSPAPYSAPLPAVTAPAGAAVAVPVMPAAAAPMANDPITEAPMAVWYVRPPAGGQFGPARGDVMRKWVGEGRVTADSLVWREGWPDWRNAAKIFPSLGTPVASVATVPVVADAPRRAIRGPRKGSSASGIGIVIALGLVCLGLFAALLYVLMNSGTPAT